MKILLSWSFILFGVLLGNSQSQHFELKADAFYGVDDFDAYYFSKDNVFYKVQDLKLQQFYDVQLGDLTEVDLINPLRILLFYKDTQTVVLLDNRLNETQRFVLNELRPYRYFEHVRLAGERRLWLHDLDQNRIQLYDYINDRVVVNTPVLKKDVVQLCTDYNFCHVVSDQAIQSFNTYGSETSITPLKEAGFLSYDFGTLIVKQPEGWSLWKFNKDYKFEQLTPAAALEKIDLDLIEQSDLQTPAGENQVKSLYLKGGKLYIWHGKRVLVYHLNLNKN